MQVSIRFVVYVFGVMLSGAAIAKAPSTKPDIDSQAVKFLKETFAVYKNCKSYQHEAELVMTIRRNGKEQKQSKTTKLIIEKPNKIFFQWLSFVLTSDGKNIQTYFIPLRQFMLKPTPTKLTQKYISDMIMVNSLTPILNAIYSDKPYETFTKKVKHLIYAGEVKLDGKPCWKLKYTRNSSQEEMLIDSSNHIIKQIIVRPASIERADWRLTITYKNIQFNKPVDESEFTVTPPPGARKVDRFSFTRWYGYPMEGKSLPDATLPDMQSGKDIPLGSLLSKKVTFITFWASWCPPCRMELPELQKLYNKYKGKGFQVIGINLDRDSSVKRAIEFAKKLKLTFPILRDSKEKLTAPMGISSIPTMLIVDGKGKIIEAHQGFSRQGENEFSEIIEKMIAGTKK